MNQYPSQSELMISTCCYSQETVLESLYFTAPFKVMKPFKRNEFMELMVLNVSAGVLSGDRQAIQFQIGSGSHVRVTAQSYEKIHRMEKGEGRRTTEISLDAEATLVYHPLPVIPFAGSAFHSNTKIQLKDSTSKLIYCEVVSCGRAARGERFQYQRFQSQIEIRRDGKLLYWDHLLLLPQSMKLEGFHLYEGYTHMGAMVAFHLPYDLAVLREILNAAEVCGGLSRLDDGGLAIRLLGNSAEEILKVQERLEETLLGY